METTTIVSQSHISSVCSPQSVCAYNRAVISISHPPHEDKKKKIVNRPLYKTETQCKTGTNNNRIKQNGTHLNYKYK